MSTQSGPRRSWPAWLAPLRPDDVTRARMKGEILRRARPVLEDLGEPAWRKIAAGWSRVGAPVAVAVVFLFSWLASRAEPPSDLAAEPETTATEELLVEPGSDVPPALLTARTAPDRNGVLQAALEGED